MDPFLDRYGGTIVAGLLIAAIVAAAGGLCHAARRWGPTVVLWLIRPVRVPPGLILVVAAALIWAAIGTR
jgi:hypothetical protein